MASDNGIPEVKDKIAEAYRRRRNAAIALGKRYALWAKQAIVDLQGTEQQMAGDFWTNRTSQAIRGVVAFSGASQTDVFWGVAHTMEYGKWLELANDRKHAALEPAVKELSPDFMAAIHKIYGD
jgi:hypothetical protein